MHRYPLLRILGLVVGYIVCFWSIRLIVLTIVAFTFVRSPEQSNMALQKIADLMRANQVLTYGGSALIFVVLLHALHPLTHTQFRHVFNWLEFKTYFPANALNGLILATVLILGTTLGGHMSYLGVYMKFDEVALSMASAMLFGFCLLILIVVEEYILRQVIEPKVAEGWSPIIAALVSSGIFLIIKLTQFELTLIQSMNLVLLNLTFSMVARNERTYIASASFQATFMVFIHVVFGLPFMGQDMPGIFLLRAASDDSLGSLLSGGISGPEGGIVLSVLLVIYLYLPQIRSKKIAT